MAMLEASTTRRTVPLAAAAPRRLYVHRVASSSQVWSWGSSRPKKVGTYLLGKVHGPLALGLGTEPHRTVLGKVTGLNFWVFEQKNTFGKTFKIDSLTIALRGLALHQPGGQTGIIALLRCRHFLLKRSVCIACSGDLLWYLPQLRAVTALHLKT